jgi:hypothetical protein
MKKLALGFCGALMFAGLSVPALAAAPAKSAPAKSTASSNSGSNFGSVISEGQAEVGGLLAWFKSDVYDAGFLSANGGYMYTDQLELRVSWIALLGDVSGGFISPGADWYFTNLDLPVIPYAGAAYALAYGDADDLSSIDLHVGVKQFLTERLALDYRLQYLEPTDSDFDSTQFFQIGFAYYL